MRLFGLTIRRDHRGKAAEEAEGTQVRLSRLESEVRAVQEQGRRLEAVAARVEAAELARESGFLKAIEALRSVLGRIDARRGRQSRLADGGGSDDGDAGDDWLGGYLALRGRAARPSSLGPEQADVGADGE